MTDIHVHSCYSNDSELRIQQILQTAEEKGWNCACISDHIDSIQDQRLNCIEEIKRLFSEVKRIKQQQSNGLDIIVGYEFSEPHKNLDMYRWINQFEFDYRMCSVHHDKNGIYPHKGVQNKKAYVREYLDEVIRMVESVEFDILGHFDLPRRYFGEFVYDQKEIRHLFQQMRNKSIILEVNTSVQIGNIVLDYLDDYFSCGNNKIVLGSDAHKIEDIGRNFDKVISLLPEGCVVGHYKKRQFICDYNT